MFSRFTLFLCLALPAALQGQEPAKGKAESLPAPKLAPVAFPAQYRVNRYQVWQYYGVDSYGQFRPLVIYGPSGAYYLINGAPFPWVQTHSREFMPYVVD